MNWLKVNGNKYYQCEELENGIIREIECDIEEKWMKVRERKDENEEWNEIDLNGLKHHDVIDLNENGDRWEGDSLNGNPFGYGCIYNSENQLKYTGFMFEGMKVCYGIEMYEDVGIVEYEGGYYVNARCGYGKLYTNDNKLKYEGEWQDGNPNDSGLENLRGNGNNKVFNCDYHGEEYQSLYVTKELMKDVIRDRNRKFKYTKRNL